MAAEDNRVGMWFFDTPATELPALVVSTIRENPEDIVDLVDMSRLGANTLQGLFRYGVLMGSIAAHAASLPEELAATILPDGKIVE